MEKTDFLNEDQINEGLFLIADTVVGETTYILCSDTDPEEEDCECFIMKKDGEDGEDEIFVPVEDDDEYEAVAKIFGELLGEEDIELV